MRIIFSFARGKPLAYISHLDLMRLLQRALRRSGLPLAYSAGFNPRMRLNLALPLPLGVTAGRELGEVHLSEQIEPAAFITALSPQLPEGLKLIDAVESTEQAPPLAARVTAARYRAILKSRTECPEIQGKIGKAVADLLKDDEILSPRTDKKKRKISYTNIRPYIFELDIAENHQEIVLSMLVKAGSDGGVSPSFLLQKIEEKILDSSGSPFHWSIERDQLYTSGEGAFKPFIEGV